MMFQGSQNTFDDLKGPKVKYNLHKRSERGDVLRPRHSTIPAAVITSMNKSWEHFRAKKNIHKNERRWVRLYSFG